MNRNRRTWMAASVLLMAFAMVGWTAQPEVAGGITIQALDAHPTRAIFYVRTNVVNQSQVPISINRDLITITLPNGRTLPRSVGRFEVHETYVIPPGGSHPLNFDFRADSFHWEEFSQLQVNWNGSFTANGSPIALPPWILTP